MAVGQFLGNLVDIAGHNLGVPSGWNISEKIAGGPTIYSYGNSVTGAAPAKGYESHASQGQVQGASDQNSSYVTKTLTTPQGGGGSFGDLLNKGGGGGNPGDPNANNNNPTGPSQDDLLNEVNSMYSGYENYLNDAENALRNDYPNVLKEAEAQYNTTKSQLDSSRTSTLNKISQSEDKATGMKDNALAEARRLYDQLQRGYLQRFGGSSSAGQAASEIGSVEQQRQMGSVNRDYRSTIQQIEAQRIDVENQYETQKLSLEQAKQQAIGQANRDFQNKLLEIGKMRAEIGQNKSIARLEALRELRARVYQIEDENRQFQMQLDAQRQAAQLSLQQYAQQATQSIGNTSSYVDEFGNIQYAPSTNMTVQGGGGAYQNPLLTGQIARGREDEELRASVMPQQNASYMPNASYMYR